MLNVLLTSLEEEAQKSSETVASKTASLAFYDDIIADDEEEEVRLAFGNSDRVSSRFDLRIDSKNLSQCRTNQKSKTNRKIVDLSQLTQELTHKI